MLHIPPGTPSSFRAGHRTLMCAQCGLAVRDIAFMAVGGIMAVFFTIFTIAMQCDQYETLTTDVTGVESMKQWDKEERTLWQGLQAVCGKPSLAWLLPTPGPEKSYELPATAAQ